MTDRDRVESLLEEWLERLERGEAPEPQALVESHPELADALKARIEALDLVDAALARGAPRRIADFRILREIGRGGMGVVYEAEQVSMKRRVALKVLSLSFTGAPQAVKRFEREAQAAGTLHHTNVVPVYAMGEHQGHWYYAMELVQGRPLSEVIAGLRAQRRPTEESLAGQGPRSPLTSGTDTGDRSYFVRVAGIFAGVAEALHLAHGEGIVHRDIKPSNLLLDADGVLKIVDFGLARVASEGPSVTITGDLLGTPAYMSPEQAMAKRMAIDHRTDIYSLGATLYEALALRPPFEGSSIQEICSQIITKDPVPPRRANAKVPRDLETVVLKAMEKDREKRYATAGAFARDLRRFAEGAAIQARRIGPLGRAWRKVKRHRVRSALVAAALLLAATTGLFALSAAREARRHSELEYARLCDEATGSFGPATEQMSLRDREQGEVPLRVEQFEIDDRARESLDRAIELLPARPEAYLLRALAPGRTLAERLADLDAARFRGLDEGTCQRGRAYLLEAAGDWEKARVAGVQAEAWPLGTTEAKYFAAILFHGQGNRDKTRQLLDQAIEESPGGSLIHRLALRSRSRLLAMEGQLARALADLMRLEDSSRAVRVEIAALWHRLGEPEEAERRLEEILAEVRETDTAAAWTELCQACRKRRQWKWAVRVAREALDRHDDSADVRAEHAAALVQSGDLVGGLEAAERAIRLHRTNRDAYIAKGVALRGLGRPGEAVEAYEKAKELRPWSVVAMCHLGDAFRESGRHAEALREYEGAVALNPRDSDAHMRRGLALKGLSRYAEARAALDHAVDLDPFLGDAVFNRGVLEAVQGHYAEALPYFVRAVEIDPESWRAWESKGRVLGKLGSHDEALGCFDQAIRLAPSEPSPYIERGVILCDHFRKFEDALGDLDKAISLASLASDLALANINRGVALLWLDRFEEAAAAYRRAGDLGDPNGYYRCGCVLLKNLRRPEEALEAFDKVHALDPGHPVRTALAHSLAAHGYFDCGLLLSEDPEAPQGALEALTLRRLEAAVHAYRQAIGLRPDYAEAHCNLGHCLRRSGRFQDALDALRQGHDLGSRNPDWPYESAAWVKDCERLVELDGRLSRVLAGEAGPAGAQERFALARVCRAKRLHAAEARFFREALSAEPELLEVRGVHHRYNAACAAALAGCGVGEDARALGDVERLRWRTEALEWLRAELAAWRRHANSEDGTAKKDALDMLARWKRDPDLAGVRDDAGLASLPADERAAWQAFWAEVDEALAKDR